MSSRTTEEPERRGRAMRTRRRGQDGAAGVWLLLIALGIFPMVLGMVVDGGTAVEDRVSAKRAAEQAARGAADELSVAAVRSGNDVVSAEQAAARARKLLGDAGWTGTVTVRGTTVTVSVTGPPTRTKFLNVVGVTSFPVRVTGTATAITSPDG